MEHRFRIEYSFNYDECQAQSQAILEEYLTPPTLERVKVLGDEKRLQTTLDDCGLATYSGSSSAGSKELSRYLLTRMHHLGVTTISEDVDSEWLVQLISKLKLCAHVNSNLQSSQSLCPILNPITTTPLVSGVFQDRCVKEAFEQVITSLKFILGDLTPQCLVHFIYRHKLGDVKSTLQLFQSLYPILDPLTSNLLLSELFQNRFVKQAFDRHVTILKTVLKDLTSEFLVRFIYGQKLCDVEFTLQSLQSLFPILDSITGKSLASKLLQDGSIKLAFEHIISLKSILGDLTPECLVETIYRHKLCDVKSSLRLFQSLCPTLDSIPLNLLLSKLFQDWSVKQAFEQMARLKSELGDPTPEWLVEVMDRHNLRDVESTLQLIGALVPDVDSSKEGLLSVLFQKRHVQKAFHQISRGKDSAVPTAKLLVQFMYRNNLSDFNSTLQLFLSLFPSLAPSTVDRLFQDQSVKLAFKQMVSLKTMLGDVTPESLVQLMYRRKLYDVKLTLQFFRSQDLNLDSECEQNPVSMLLREHHVQQAFQHMILEKYLGGKINSQSLQEYILARRLSSVQSTFESFRILLPDLENHSAQNPFIRHLDYCVRQAFQQIILQKLFVHFFCCILVVGFVFEYLMGYVQRGGWATYSDTSWEFRATYVSIELRLAAYFWIKFRAPTQFSSNGPGHGPPNVLPAGPTDLPTPRRKRKAAPGEPSISCKRYPGYVKYEPRVYASGKRVSLGEYRTREQAANVFWVAGYYHRYVSADELPFDATSLPEIPPELSGEDCYSWIKTKAKEWAASKSLDPEGRPPTLSTGEDCAVRDSFTSPTGTSEPPSSSVLPAQDQQDWESLFEAPPCQLTEGNSTRFATILQDFNNELGDNTSHPCTNILDTIEHASTGLVNKRARSSGYLISAPPGARADHSCTLTVLSAFEEFAKQGWEVSFNRGLDTNYYLVRAPTASHDREAPALVLSPTIISAFTEFKRGDWTVEFLDR